MVDEVEITNVGGNGVASEVTLKKLHESMAKMAKEKNVDVSKAQSATDQLAKKLRGGSEATEDFSDALDSAGSRLASFGKKAFDAIGESAVGLANELASSSNNLSDFAQHIPGIGGAMSRVTGVIDDSFNAFQSMASSGASFGYDLGELRSQVASSGLSMQEYSQLISDSSESMAAFGGTVERGARRTQRMMDALGDQRVELQALGVTQEELNESLVFYQQITRAGARAEQRSVTDQAEAAASLTKNMLTLSKLTGEDVKAQQEKIQQAQMDVAFQRELARIDEDERQKINAAMLEAQQTGGQVAVDALKAEYLGMPPLTEELQIFTATQQETAGLIRDSVAAVRDEAVTAVDFMEGQEDRLVSFGEAALRAQNATDDLTAAAAAGAGGIPATIAEQQQAGLQFITGYLQNEGDKLTLDLDAMRQDIREAGQLDPGEETRAMAEFRDGLRNTRSTLVDNVINPMADELAPAIATTTSRFNELAQSEGFSNLTKTIGDNILAVLGVGAGVAAGAKVAPSLTSRGLRSSSPDIDTDQDRDNKKGRRGGVGRFLKGGARLASKAALPLTGLLAAYEGIQGAANAGEILGAQQGEEIGIGDRAAAGLGNALEGLSFGLINRESVARGLTGRGDDESRGGELEQQDLATAQAASTVSDAQMERLEKLVGFAPRVTALKDSVSGFQSTFNELDLNYREIDRTTRSLEKMAEQLEEINNQLQGDQGFLDKLNPFSNNDEQQTAGDVVSGSQNGSSEQIEKLNRVMTDILGVLMQSNDMNKKQLNATRSMTGNLYR